ncbi:MAG: hypothetical protein ACXACI_00885 [Candidatus Hodarchaeales archaeon]
MREKNTLAQMRALYAGSRSIHKGSFAISLFFFLWMFSGLSGLLVPGEPVWMYTGRGTTITRYFPFRIHYVTDVEVRGEHITIITDRGLTLDSVSWATYILAMIFVFTLVLLWLPVIPSKFGSENVRDLVVGLFSLLLFILLVMSTLEDGRSIGEATNFSEQVENYDLRSRNNELESWSWEEYVSFAGFRGDSDYQLYIAASLLFFTLVTAIFTTSISGMLLSSKQQLSSNNRGLRNISLVLAILFIAAAITICVPLIPFTRNADFLPGVPMFAVLLLMAGASFIDWKQFESLDGKEEEFSLRFWIMVFVVIQVIFVLISLFFAEHYLDV